MICSFIERRDESIDVGCLPIGCWNSLVLFGFERSLIFFESQGCHGTFSTISVSCFLNDIELVRSHVGGGFNIISGGGFLSLSLVPVVSLTIVLVF